MSLPRPRRGRDDGRAGGEDDDRWESAPAKRPRHCSCSCPCCRETKDFYEAQFEILKKEMQRISKGYIEDRKNSQREMQEFYQNTQLQLNGLISEHATDCQLIWGRFNTMISKIITHGDNGQEYRNLREKSRTFRLKFENKLCNDKYSRHDITADDGSPIKVAVYDHDNQIITNGPLSSMQVKIVVLDGEFNKDNKEQWTEDSFLKNIIWGRTGKPPLFANELYLRLENGVANLCGAKFQDNSSFVPSKKFRLGVMAADDGIPEKVLEGISDSFAVKDGRGFQKKKDPYPSLSDPIYKLRKIAENGDRHKLLEKMDIHLVQDFLRYYNKDENSLRQACGSISDHDWKIIVAHALSCKPGVNGRHTCYEEPNDTQKDVMEESKTTAYENVKVVQYEDKDMCHENEMIVGEKGSCCLLGSSSMPPFPPTPPTRIHGDIAQPGMVLESPPGQQSPRPLQRWVRVVTVVKTLRFWNKKSELSATYRAMCSIPLPESSSGMTQMLDDFWSDLGLE